MTVAPSIPRPCCSDRRSSNLRLLLWASLLAMTFLMLPFDQAISTWTRSLQLPHDVDQELRWVQQFGQIGSLVIVFVMVWMMQPPNIRRSMFDLGLSILVVLAIAFVLKTLIGRLRPAFGTADEFHAVWMDRGETTLSLTARQSIPSSHTAAGVILATWIWYVFPPIRWIGVVLACLLGVARVRFGAHWPSDIFAGALLATVLTSVIVRRQLGTRMFDVLWRIVVNRDAKPRWPEVRATIASRQPHGAVD